MSTSEQYGTADGEDGDYSYGESNDDDGWFGADDEVDESVRPTPARRTTTPARFVPRRTIATVRPRANVNPASNNNNNQQQPSPEDYNDYEYYQNDNNQQQPEPTINYFGAGRQPNGGGMSFDRGLPPPLTESEGEAGSGLTTTHIIIIAGAVVGVFFIIAVSCLVAKCCFKKKDKQVQNHHAMHPHGPYYTWNGERSMNRLSSLPGHHSTLSSTSTHHHHQSPPAYNLPDKVVYRNTDPIYATADDVLKQPSSSSVHQHDNSQTPFRPTALNPETLPPLQSVMSSHSNHPSFKHSNTLNTTAAPSRQIYTNGGATTPRAPGTPHLQRVRSFSARSLKRNPSFDGRPLPPIPTSNKQPISKDIDEDYYSGDNDDTVTMRDRKSVV